MFFTSIIQWNRSWNCSLYCRVTEKYDAGTFSLMLRGHLQLRLHTLPFNTHAPGSREWLVSRPVCVCVCIMRVCVQHKSWKNIQTSDTVSLLAKIVAMIKFFLASLYGSRSGIWLPVKITGFPRFCKGLPYSLQVWQGGTFRTTCVSLALPRCCP